MTKIKCLTLTVITESQVALSNDQGTGGNYTPVKKMFYKDGVHLFASVSTFTYELRRILKEEFGWKLFDIFINRGTDKKPKNVVNRQIENESEEADLFGYLLPSEQVNRLSPLRVIPPISLNRYHFDTQLITNRGFLNRDLGRDYYDIQDNKTQKTDNVPTTLAFASEEVMGDYYQYTVTVELERIGRNEIQQDGEKFKVLTPGQYSYKDAGTRKKIVTDFLGAIKIFTRKIKHQTVFLEPQAIFGGLFSQVVPYFANSILFKNNELYLGNIKQTVDNYGLGSGSFLIKAVNSRIGVNPVEEFTIENNPVGKLNELITCINDKVIINENNEWILE